jgi:hypothetical protein
MRLPVMMKFWMNREIEFIDEKNNGDEYEMKWSQLRAQINVRSLINLSGATKILSSQQTAKSFFDFMFQRQH